MSIQIKTLTAVGLFACGGTTDVVGLRKDGTRVDGAVVERRGDILVIQEDPRGGDVGQPLPPPIEVPIGDLRAIDIDRPGNVAVGFGILGSAVGFAFLGLGAIARSGDDPDATGEKFSNALFAMGGVFLGTGIGVFLLGNRTMNEANEQLGPALRLPDLPPEAW